eukprot:Skav228469  [mRNA]  locus=scaffold1233:184108:188089:+ [translate_table: standard]
MASLPEEEWSLELPGGNVSNSVGFPKTIREVVLVAALHCEQVRDALKAGAVSLAEVASLMSKFHLLGSSDGQNDQQVQLATKPSHMTNQHHPAVERNTHSVQKMFFYCVHLAKSWAVQHVQNDYYIFVGVCRFMLVQDLRRFCAACGAPLRLVLGLGSALEPKGGSVADFVVARERQKADAVAYGGVAVGVGGVAMGGPCHGKLGRSHENRWGAEMWQVGVLQLLEEELLTWLVGNFFGYDSLLCPLAGGQTASKSKSKALL